MRSVSATKTSRRHGKPEEEGERASYLARSHDRSFSIFMYSFKNNTGSCYIAHCRKNGRDVTCCDTQQPRRTFFLFFRTTHQSIEYPVRIVIEERRHDVNGSSYKSVRRTWVIYYYYYYAIYIFCLSPKDNIFAKDTNPCTVVVVVSDCFVNGAKTTFSAHEVERDLRFMVIIFR